MLVCVSHLFRLSRLAYLSDVVAALHDLDAAGVDIVVFTDAAEPGELSVLHRLLSKYTAPGVTVTFSSHPTIQQDPRGLPWLHREFVRQQHQKEGSPYTHYLYLEDDILFSRRNLQYFLKFREALRPHGLVPGMLRYEYNETGHDIFTPDQHGRQDFQSRQRVFCQDVEFIGLDVPYAGMSLLDRELMDEFLASPSFGREASAGVVNWGDLERASMGLTWEGVPAGFPSRLVIPLRSGTETPDAMCWVKHIPGNFTNDYSPGPNFVLGKTRMDEIFFDFTARNARQAVISCHDTQPGPGRPISSGAELYASLAYHRPDPVIEASARFGTDLQTIYGRINAAHPASPRSSLVSFTTAYVIGPVLYVDTGRGLALLQETYRSNDRDFVTAPHSDEILAGFVAYPPEAESCTIFIGSAGSFNYGHWLVDDLPRLQSVYALRRDFPDRRIRILLSSFGEPMDSVRRKSAEMYLAGTDNISIEFLDPARAYRIEALYYASPISLHPVTKSPAAIRSVRDRIVPAPVDLPANPGNRSRIFVTRRPPDSRTLLNHDEISSFLMGYGFQVVDVNGLDFEQQVDIFSQADVVVGCMGAAMTNTIFCRRPATIVMLAPEGWIEPFYWDLAAARGDSYLACYGTPERHDVPAHSSSYTIDLARVATVINRLGLSRRRLPRFQNVAQLPLEAQPAAM